MKTDLSRVQGFIYELDDLNQGKAVNLLRMLEASRLPRLPAPHGEHVERDLYALLIMTKTNIRLYDTVFDGTAVMLCGLYKKTRKIPAQVLDQCRREIRQIRAQGGHR